ncbi:MAG TPA: DHHA1 domain-containing protein [Candidatus Saccharimonadaceae bacterium]|nr:DHHA1 domain-containing protein [Candidatus Saccharimonadaceae bacterium]
MSLFERILAARGLTPDQWALFVSPEYEAGHDPFLLPDMAPAVERLVAAHQAQEKITIYGDYDIDGLTATTLLLDAFRSFGFENVEAFIPNRFVEGYGLTLDAIEKIAADGTGLIVTVDCGSLSHKEVSRAKELGVDVIITDHHNVADTQPDAIAVINPKRLLADHPERYENFILKRPAAARSKAGETARSDSSPDSLSAAELARARTSSPRQVSAKESVGSIKASSQAVTGHQNQDLYPFVDLPGVGVAFKLVQALQTRLDGLPKGQEKWLLDLVALGTVCDGVTLRDENRMHVYWGLKVLAKTQRPGLKALMAVSGVRPETLNARSLGFGLGPRMNASGRMETAQHALDMLRATDPMEALRLANQLDAFNKTRRADQNEIFEAAKIQAEEYKNDSVLVVSGKGWNHGIVGIVAAKLLEKYHKPTYVLEEMGEESKGSARSYGDFSAADAIRAADDLIIKGGGHKLAAGVTLPTKNIEAFRRRVNEFYEQQKLTDQASLLLPKADTDALLYELEEAVVQQIAQLEPFGNGNPQPILRSVNTIVRNQRRMGDNGQHVKLTVEADGRTVDMLAFNAPDHFFVDPGQNVTIWYTLDINEWQGRRTVEGMLLHLEVS